MGLYVICVWNWNWWLTQDHFLIKHWSHRTHRCSAVRCWPWGVNIGAGQSLQHGEVRGTNLAWVRPVVRRTVSLFVMVRSLPGMRRTSQPADRSISGISLWLSGHGAGAASRVQNPLGLLVAGRQITKWWNGEIRSITCTDACRR